MSLYKQQREQVKEVILNTAIALFKEKGYDKVSVDEITKKVGVAKGTFYNFFSSKKDILMCWSEQQFHQMDGKSLANAGKSIQDSLFTLIDILVSIIKQEQGLFVSFLREIMQMSKVLNTESKFDFKQILKDVISGSIDYSSLGEECMELKIRVLNNTLFYEILEWFCLNKPIEGLDMHLKNIIRVCLYGVLNNIKESKD